MSRLYLKAGSDTNNNLKTMTGHEEISVNLLWGSVGRSLKAATIYLDWTKGSEVPTLTVEVGEDIKYVALGR